MNITRLVLASNSPRRQEMVRWLALPYRVQAAVVDESSSPVETPWEYVVRLAQRKAEAVQPDARSGELIMAADTIVVDGKDLLGKPESPEAARTMLKRLRGRSHQVYTAVCLIAAETGQVFSDYCVSQVPMREYTDLEIEAYIASGDPFDKAGGYAIQNPQFRPVLNFSQCYACVMGLPLCHLVRLLAQIGPTFQACPPTLCRHHLGYECTFYGKILNSAQIGKTP